MKLHKFRGRYNPTLPFVPWLFTICRSELLDQLKMDRRRQLEIVMGEIPDVGVDQTKQSHRLEVDISRLSSEQRDAIEMRFNRDFSFDEIARELETSSSNARQIVSRALRTLRGMYGKK